MKVFNNFTIDMNHNSVVVHHGGKLLELYILVQFDINCYFVIYRVQEHGHIAWFVIILINGFLICELGILG